MWQNYPELIKFSSKTICIIERVKESVIFFDIRNKSTAGAKLGDENFINSFFRLEFINFDFDTNNFFSSHPAAALGKNKSAGTMANFTPIPLVENLLESF